MKPLAILAGAVLLLLSIWWLIGAGLGGSGGPVPLVLPSDPKDKPGLIRASHQLWKAQPDYYDPGAVLSFLQRLNETLDDSEWRAVSSQVFFAWEQHRKIVSRRPAISTLNATLLPRFVRAGSMADLEGLIRVGNEKSFDTAAIDKALLVLATAPLPPSGYDGSRFSELAAASIRAGDLKRAKSYLKGLVWAPDTAEELKAPAARVSQIVDLCLAAEAGRYEFPGTVQVWVEQGADTIGRTALRPVLEDIALRAAKTSEAPVADILALFEASRSVEGSVDYWNNVISRFMPQCLEGHEFRIGRLESLSTVYGATFDKKDYAFRLFMRGGPMIEKMSPEDSLRAVRFYEIALGVAPTDAARVEAVRKAVAGQMKVLEFPRARKTVEGALATLQDPEAIKAVKLLSEDVRKKSKADDERVATTEKLIEVNRTQNRLIGYKERLAAARKDNRPQEEIDSLRRTISILEKELPE